MKSLHESCSKHDRYKIAWRPPTVAAKYFSEQYLVGLFAPLHKTVSYRERGGVTVSPTGNLI